MSENEPASGQLEQLGGDVANHTSVPKQSPEPITINGENEQDQSMNTKPAEVPYQDLLNLGEDSAVAHPSLTNSDPTQITNSPPAPSANGDVDLLFLGPGDGNGDSADSQPKSDDLLSSFPAGESQPAVDTLQPATSPFGDLLSLGTDNNRNAASILGNLSDPSALTEASHQPHSGDAMLTQPAEPLNLPSPTSMTQEDLLPEVSTDAAAGSGHDTGDTAKEQSSDHDLLSLGQSAEHENAIAEQPVQKPIGELFQPTADPRDATQSFSGESKPHLSNNIAEAPLPTESAPFSEGPQWLNPEQDEATPTNSRISPATPDEPSHDMPPPDENIDLLAPTVIEKMPSSNSATPDGPTSGDKVDQIAATEVTHAAVESETGQSVAKDTNSSYSMDLAASTSDDGLGANTNNDGSGIQSTSVAEPLTSITEPTTTNPTLAASTSSGTNEQNTAADVVDMSKASDFGSPTTQIEISTVGTSGSKLETMGGSDEPNEPPTSVSLPPMQSLAHEDTSVASNSREVEDATSSLAMDTSKIPASESLPSVTVPRTDVSSENVASAVGGMKEKQNSHEAKDIASISKSTASEPSTLAQPQAAGMEGDDSAVLSSNSDFEGAINKTPPCPDPSKMPRTTPDTPLPQQVKWLEQELHAAHTLIMKLQQQQGEEEEANDESKRESNTVMVDLQANLQSQMSKRAEAEDAARLAKAKAEKLGKQVLTIKEEMETKVKELNKNLMAALEEKTSLAAELESTKEERDEQARKEASLVNRLNAAKKKEAAKANAAEHYEEQVESLQNQVTQLQGDLASVTEEKKQIQQQLVHLQKSSQQRIQQLDSALTEERRLNDERKRKMKGFVEAKAEEIRSSKETHVSLQTELDQTNRSLMELNQRWKQLHAQWVQSQTRNRELQRDMNKMKKDSEKMHTVGDTLQMKLSRSALETEEHKNKRLTAKNELMSVLRQLEAERDLTNRLRDSIKFTFTPKAISQQQIIQETLGEFENELQRLARRLGRPLAPPDDSMIDTVGEPPLDATDSSDNPDEADLNVDPGRTSVAEANAARLLSKLESETQRVSQCIMSFSANVERMHTVLAGPGTRNCVSVLQDLLAASGRGGPEPSNEETAAMTSSTRRATGGTRYGQVAGSIT